MTIDEREFRSALGLFPTGVAIVTTVAAGERLGLTVSSFNSVSLSPPLILFSVARSANSFAAWRQAQTYAVNILHEDQHALSTSFARALSAKWDGVQVLPGDTRAPLLPNALAAFECEAHAHYDGGDHEIFVGRVLSIRAPTRPDPRPLVFYRGRYRKLAPEIEATPPKDDTLYLHGW